MKITKTKIQIPFCRENIEKGNKNCMIFVNFFCMWESFVHDYHCLLEENQKTTWHCLYCNHCFCLFIRSTRSNDWLLGRAFSRCLTRGDDVRHKRSRADQTWAARNTVLPTIMGRKRRCRAWSWYWVRIVLIFLIFLFTTSELKANLLLGISDCDYCWWWCTKPIVSDSLCSSNLQFILAVQTMIPINRYTVLCK